jgi:hypothetical protein
VVKSWKKEWLEHFKQKPDKWNAWKISIEKMSPLLTARRMWKESIQLRVCGCGLDFSSLTTYWLEAGHSGGFLWIRYWCFGIHMRAEFFWPHERLSFYQKWPYSTKLPLTLQLYYVFRHKSTVSAWPNQCYTCPFQQHILIPVSIPLHGLPPNQSREPPSVSTNPSPTLSLSSVKGKVTLLCIPVLPSDG